MPNTDPDWDWKRKRKNMPLIKWNVETLTETYFYLAKFAFFSCRLILVQCRSFSRLLILHDYCLNYFLQLWCVPLFFLSFSTFCSVPFFSPSLPLFGVFNSLFFFHLRNFHCDGEGNPLYNTSLKWGRSFEVNVHVFGKFSSKKKHSLKYS